MKARKLPINDKPPVYGYLHHALPLAMMTAHEQCMPWFHSNYVQLSADPAYADAPCPEDIFVNFYHPVHIHHLNPLLDITLLSTEVLDQTTQDIVGFLKAAIDRGQYVYLFLDEYYIPDKSMFQKQHYAHDILLYGYDDATGRFDTLGFNGKAEFGSTPVDYDRIVEAYRNADRPQDWMREVILYRPDENKRYAFDPRLVFEGLQDYLQSRNSSNRYRTLANPKPLVYGMNVYGEIARYVERLLADPAAHANIIPFHVLWEHKKCMLERFQYMAARGHAALPDEIMQPYVAVERAAYEMRRKFYKYAYFLRDDVQLGRTIVTQVQQLAAAEESVLGRILEAGGRVN